MKLQELFEKINRVQHHVLRDDLIAILDVLDKNEGAHAENCFITAVAHSLSVMSGKKIQGKDLESMLRQKNPGYHYSKVHPNMLLKRLSSDSHDISLTYTMVSSVQEIKSWLSKKVPVILSIRWSNAYYHPARHIRVGDDNAWLNFYKDMGASEEMLKKAKQGIIPYPTDEYLDQNREFESTTHAIVCYGYDAGAQAFICMDLGWAKDSRYKRSMKIEEKIFFDKKLAAAKNAIVEAALVVEIEELDGEH